LDEELSNALTEEEQKKVRFCMKQTLNLKVERVFWTPLRNGLVVVYQSKSENILRFSKNRVETNSSVDFLMLNGNFIWSQGIIVQFRICSSGSTMTTR
jgi:hypothetical protein